MRNVSITGSNISQRYKYAFQLSLGILLMMACLPAFSVGEKQKQNKIESGIEQPITTEQPGSTPNFYSLEPGFTVNIHDSGTMRYMQVGVDLMTMDPRVIEAIETYLPPIRHELIMLFTERDVKDLLKTGGREQLRLDALQSVRAVLKKYADISSSTVMQDPLTGVKYPSGLQDLLFTNLVIQ